MEISIIVRFHNEEFYLPLLMEALVQQDFPAGQFEIIAIDNCSTDNSKEIAARYTANLLSIDDYKPGKALNLAISRARGKNIAVLSAHAIPSNRAWLGTLHAHLRDDVVAGVYGGQLYPVDSRFLDKRDLDIFSTLEPRVEKTASDFWNANSMFSRSKWERQPFDETIYELEDHYWTKQVLPRGYEVHFEPAALVYHYGHVERIDREYLEETSLSPGELIENAIADLESSDDWPTLMSAGLTLSSLTRAPEIKRAIHPLGKKLLTHADFDVRWRMAQALGKIPDAASADYLTRALFDTSFYPRDEAAWSLARLGAISVSNVVAHLDKFPTQIIPFAALALGGSGVRSAEERAVQLLLDEISSGDYARQRDATYFAGEIVEASTSERLIWTINQLLEAEDGRLQAVCCWALGSYAAKGYEIIDWTKIESLAQSHADLLTRFEAVVALGKCALVRPYKWSWQLLKNYLMDHQSRIRYGAIQSIRRLMELKAEPSLMRSLEDWQEDDDFGVIHELNLIRRLKSSN
jgi:HEAT repeat protein